MTALNQDFTLYVGDDAAPVFTVTDDGGAVVDLEDVLEIAWLAQRDAGGPPVISKTKTAGQIAFVNAGVDGKFKVLILPGDTAGLNGFYLHLARVTDAAGKITTVTLGRVAVVPTMAATWTYGGDPSASAKDAVRFFVQDTVESDPQFQDAEINYVLTKYPQPRAAAAVLADIAAAKYARFADKAVGDLRISYGQRVKAYQSMAAILRAEAAIEDLTVYSGGISVGDKQKVESNTDRVRPPFKIGKDDYFPPEGSVPIDDGSDWIQGP